MANADSLKGLMKWLGREEWRRPYNGLIERHLGPPCERAGIAFHELADKIGGEHVGILWGCMFEDFLAFDLDDDSNIVDDYLKRRGWKESVPNKRYMMALRSSVMSLYEVSNIVRDQSFLARDLLRGGEPVRISEKSATRSLKQWDLIAARVVPMGSKIEMAGGVLAFRHALGETVRETFAVLRKGMLSEVRKSAEPGDEDIDPFVFDTEVLRHSAFLFTHVWLDDALERVVNPTLPKLYNSDGDEIVLTTVHYPLKEACDRAELETALAAMPDLRRAGETLWNWSAAAAPAAAKAPKGAESFTSIFEDGSVSMGSVELQPKTLRLETNSPRRAQRGQALLDPVIGPFVGEPVVKTQTMAEMRAARSEDDRPAPLSSLPPAEQRAIAHEAIERHYRKLLDQPVPMLGNVSPRKAAKTKKGREKLVDWLKLLENTLAQQEADSLMSGYDVRWMWNELGIADLRR
jgi:hypothetical protein